MRLESKYDIGDRVYGPAYETHNARVACPDCLGERTWSAMTRSGESLVIDCPTCTDGYIATGYVKQFRVLPVVRSLTIGRVTYENDYLGDSDLMVFKYMCEETGVGSGTVYVEKDLFQTYEEAESVAKLLAQRTADNIASENAKQKAARIKEAGRRGRCSHCGGSGLRPR